MSIDPGIRIALACVHQFSDLDRRRRICKARSKEVQHQVKQLLFAFHLTGPEFLVRFKQAFASFFAVCGLRSGIDYCFSASVAPLPGKNETRVEVMCFNLVILAFLSSSCFLMVRTPRSTCKAICFTTWKSSCTRCSYDRTREELNRCDTGVQGDFGLHYSHGQDKEVGAPECRLEPGVRFDAKPSMSDTGTHIECHHSLLYSFSFEKFSKPLKSF
eukprot:760290-Hanusia_phi.AAC.4